MRHGQPGPDGGRERVQTTELKTLTLILCLFPAVCFGYTIEPTGFDQSSEFQAVLADYARVDLQAGGEYRLSYEVMACLPGTIIDGHGATVRFEGEIGLSATGAACAGVSATAAVCKGDWDIPVEDASGFQPGDLVRIYSDDLFATGYKASESHYIPNPGRSVSNS